MMREEKDGSLLTGRCKVYIHVARAIAISPPRSAVSVYPDRFHAPHPFRIHAPLQLRIHTLSSTSTSIILARLYSTCTTLTVSCGSPLMYLSLSLWCFEYHHLSLVLESSRLTYPLERHLDIAHGRTTITFCVQSASLRIVSR